MRERIIALRKEVGLSQAAFAEKIEVSRNFYNLYENGNRELSDRTIRTICSVFHVNEEWIRDGEGKKEMELSQMEVILERLATIKMIISNDPGSHAAELAKLRKRMAAAILNLNDECCEFMIKFLEDLGYEKKEEND